MTGSRREIVKLWQRAAEAPIPSAESDVQGDISLLLESYNKTAALFCHIMKLLFQGLELCLINA
jgi:hypothetical protein